jgi:hypothetical protein
MSRVPYHGRGHEYLMPIVLAEMTVLPILVFAFWALAYRSTVRSRRPVPLPVAVRNAANDRVVGLHRCQRAVPAFLL